MNCLKCGVQVEEGQSFCPDCLREMEKQPVPFDTVLVLPRRGESSSRRSTGKKRGLSTEEKLAQTRQQLRKYRILTIVLSVLLLLLSSACVYLMLRRQKPALGQNYSTVGTTSPTDPLPMD